MVYLFIYDIGDRKRLMKIYNILKKKGIRTQYSFFECNLTKKEMLNLYNELKNILDEEKDKLFVVPINVSDIKKVIRIGNYPRNIEGIY